MQRYLRVDLSSFFFLHLLAPSLDQQAISNECDASIGLSEEEECIGRRWCGCHVEQDHAPKVLSEHYFDIALDHFDIIGGSKCPVAVELDTETRSIEQRQNNNIIAC